MKRLASISLAVLFTISSVIVKADEGMWLPLLIKRLNYTDMQKCGLQLTPEEIYSVNNSSLKDAVVALGGGFCTGEIISKEGLMLTNHHCGYNTVQANSTKEHDYLTDGFWAMTRDQEIPADFAVWFLDRMDDVTDQVLEGVTDGMKEGERNSIIQKNIEKIKAKAKEGKAPEAFEVQVKSFYYGNEYYMFQYNIFHDVRLVGAPPSSIGKFGGDTDNWMWPRHTGDFSMFRVYANKNNEPAPYSKDNVPYKPKHHLPINLDGIKDGDYAMVMGYPGSTDRYLTSWGVKEAINIDQPTRVKIRRKKLDIMEEGMNKDQGVRIQYAAKYAQTSNYWKYFLGQSQQLVKNHVYDKKKTIEDEFTTWVRADRTRTEKYGNALTLIEESYKESEKYVLPNVYFQEAIFQGPDIFGFFLNNFGFRSKMSAALKDGSEEKINEAKKDILEHAPEYFKDYNAEIDQNLLGEMLQMYYDNVDKEFHPETMETLAKKYKGDFNKFAEKYMAKTSFTSEENLKTWLDKFSQKAIDKDPVYNLVNEFVQVYIEKIMMPSQMGEQKKARGMRLFVNGLRKEHPNKAYASDANSTMRVTYGNVLPYDPKDAVTYKFYSTLEGVMEKAVDTEDKNNEFYVPERLKELYKNKDYGQYARKDGRMPVAFISNNDITGGNSGSPVIDGKGQLIGTAFDGNWEAMSGDIYFEPNIQRTISVDIRYTLFIIDKYAGAGHLVKEMTLIKTPAKAENADVKL